MKRWGFAVVLLFAGWTVQAQSFASGTTEIKTWSGTLRVQSGRVGNFNAHDFHVYSFQMKNDGLTEQWNQVPLVVSGRSELEFIVTTAATADFATRDAAIRQEGSRLILTLAQLRFDDTPYDDDAWVELRRYQLRHLNEESRWVFEQTDVHRAPLGMTVEGFIASEHKPKP